MNSIYSLLKSPFADDEIEKVQHRALKSTFWFCKHLKSQGQKINDERYERIKNNFIEYFIYKDRLGE